MKARSRPPKGTQPLTAGQRMTRKRRHDSGDHSECTELNKCAVATAAGIEEERLCEVKALAAELKRRGLSPGDYLSAADLKASRGAEIDIVHKLRAQLAADKLLCR